MVDNQSDRLRFSQFLPLYVNDTLDADDREWMTTYLEGHPEARNELRFVQILRDTTRHTTSQVPEKQRLGRLMREWRQSRPPPSMLQNPIRWLQGLVQIPASAIAVATILIVGQAVVIGSFISSGSDENKFRGNRPECTAAPSIRVVFNPDAKHYEILLLLRKVEAAIQNGPSETGELWLTVPKGRSLEEAQAMLRGSALVDEAILTKESRLPAGCEK